MASSRLPSPLVGEGRPEARVGVEVMRVLGLDVGEKTIGVAVSDGLGISAQGEAGNQAAVEGKGHGRAFENHRGIRSGTYHSRASEEHGRSLGPQAEKASISRRCLKNASACLWKHTTRGFRRCWPRRRLLKAGCPARRGKPSSTCSRPRLFCRAGWTEKAKPPKKISLNKVTKEV